MIARTTIFLLISTMTLMSSSHHSRHNAMDDSQFHKFLDNISNDMENVEMDIDQYIHHIHIDTKKIAPYVKQTGHVIDIIGKVTKHVELEIAGELMEGFSDIYLADGIK